MDIAIGLALAALLGLWVFTDAVARNAPRPLWWGIGTFLLAIVVLPAWLLTRPPKQPARPAGPRRCPFCALPVQPTATVCMHCGQDIPGGA